MPILSSESEKSTSKLHSASSPSAEKLFFDQNRFDDAHAHVERAKSHVINHPYLLGRAMELQALFWYQEGRFKEAKSEASRAVDIYERTEAASNLEDCRALLRDIEEEMKVSGESGFNDVGKSLETMLLPTSAITLHP